MATVFPTAIDNFGSVTDNVTDVLAEQLNELRRAVEALETKVGYDGDTNVDSHDYRITDVGIQGPQGPQGSAGITDDNLLINQDFSVWQENTTFNNPGIYVYTADGYYIETNAGGGTLPTINVKKNTSEQETEFEQCCELEITNVGSSFNYWRFNQRVEGCKKYAGKTLIGSWRIKASTSITGNFKVWVYDGITYTPTTVTSLNTSWQTLTNSIGIDNSPTELRMGFSLNGVPSTTCSIYLQFIKLEIGSDATSLIPRKTADELRLCQRYYQKSYAQGTFPGAVTNNGAIEDYTSNVNNSDHTERKVVKLPVVMKAAPTVTLYDVAGNSGKITMAAGDNINGTVDRIVDNGFRVSGTNGAAATDRLLKFHYVAVSRV